MDLHQRPEETQQQQNYHRDSQDNKPQACSVVMDMLNACQKQVQQETAYSAVVVNDHIYPVPAYIIFMFL